MKNRKNERGLRSGAKPGTRAAARSRASRRPRRVKRRPLSLSTPVAESAFHSKTIADFYRPLKKPVTLRLDADVIAWFKKDGRRYQTRINSALRKVMEREMKAAEK
jgi:uncharacterized protein (DUF4415 family)